MSGLNDNFLLADDSLEPKDAPAVTVKAFKENTEDGEIPELNDDIDLIAVATEDLNIQLRDLELLEQNIQQHGGMSQTIALEAHSLLPNLINDEHPIEFFTKHPSRTMLSTALEEAAEQKKGILEKIKDFIISMYKRVVEWFKAVFGKITEKNLVSAENTATLNNAEKSMTDNTQLLLGYEKETQTVIDTAKAHADEALKAAQVKKDNSHVANLQKLAGIIGSLRSKEIYQATMLDELNSLLSRLPHVQRALSEPAAIAPLSKNHENSIVGINILLTDLKRAVEKKDHEAISKTMNSDQCNQIIQNAEALSKAIIEFRAISTDYRVSNMKDFFDHCTSSDFFTLIGFGKNTLNRDVVDQKTLLAGMETLLEDLYKMELYKWGKDPKAEAAIKESMEALKNFNKQVIVPTTQRLAFSYTIVAQLLDFLNSVTQLGSELKGRATKNLKQRIIAEAKELGIDEKEALSLFE